MKQIPSSRTLALFSMMLTAAMQSPAAPEAPAPSPPPQYPPAPTYPAPYLVPKEADIKAALDRIAQRLDEGVSLRMLDAGSREPMTDFSKPTTAAIFDRGPEWKFAPLDYPMAVIHNGMLRASEVTGDARYANFTVKVLQYFADNLPVFANWGTEGNMRGKNPFRYLLAPDTLDACGAIGTAMVKAREAKLGPDMKEVIDRAVEHVSKGQYRLDDGTLARKKPRADSVWADDLYMSVPLLAQMGKTTGEARYFDDAARQLLQISSRLFVREKSLYAHTWNSQNPEHHASYFWGRANGWCMMAMAELLDVLPENHPKRAEILKLFQEHAEGLANTQSGSGLWHQLLDRSDTFLESSCTGMFTFALARGVDRGWLDPFSYGPVAIAGWNGLSSRITHAGEIEGTCIGTNYASDAMYYINRPATDDVHGYGPTLLAGAEVIKLLRNSNLVFRGGGVTPVSVEYKNTGKP